MAKILVLVSLLVYITAAQAAQVPAEWSSSTNKLVNDMQLKVDKALKEVIAAASPDKRSEAEKTALQYKKGISILLSKAKSTGDEKKALSIVGSYEEAADMVIWAPGATKFDVMDGLFSRAAAPDPKKCPNVDKSYCETDSKINEVGKGVLYAAPGALDAMFNQASEAFYNINKAYAIGDDKEIARVLAAYNKAADAVIAAAPAEKLKVMEETFAAAHKA